MVIMMMMVMMMMMMVMMMMMMVMVMILTTTINGSFFSFFFNLPAVLVMDVYYDGRAVSCGQRSLILLQNREKKLQRSDLPSVCSLPNATA
ncbi:hypothetical protein ElyMa_005301600 [Elysia marginata]|uniref:Secreted protein n=1 Tax=Elysia marginata TaxID=1093978 RepID=A0AAV4K2E2_9GAST|nr:hypothetical protein ElyMa_005301600 [Elysia marginata]